MASLTDQFGLGNAPLQTAAPTGYFYLSLKLFGLAGGLSSAYANVLVCKKCGNLVGDTVTHDDSHVIRIP